MFNFCGITSSNRAGAWSRHIFSLIIPTTQQPHAFSLSSHTNPIAASGATNVKKVIQFVCQCKSTLHFTVRNVSHLVPVKHVQPPQATAPVTSSSRTDTERSTLYLLWTSPTAEHLTPLWPVPRETLEVWWFSFLRWWLHAWVLLTKTFRDAKQQLFFTRARFEPK